MKKYIVLSLLFIISPTCIQGMYFPPIAAFSIGSLLSLSSYLSTWYLGDQKPNDSQTANDSEIISELKKDVTNFEIQLKLFERADIEEAMDIEMDIFGKGDRDRDPIKFLQYCYYQKTHKESHNSKFIMRWNLPDMPTVLTTYQNAHIDGYSALSAAMLADVTTDAKRGFIQELINLDFKPTQKDIELARLCLYNSITIKQKAAIYYSLHALSHINWIVLPKDIKTYIAQLIIQRLKKEDSWLLPEKTDPSTWKQPYITRNEIPSVWTS